MAERAAAWAGSRYIVGPLYDWSFFLLSPLLSVVVAALIVNTFLVTLPFEYAGQEVTIEGLLIGILIHAHVFAVVFRSHGRPEIFRRHRLRFVAVPVLLYLAMLSSTWVLIGASVLTVLWDVYHSGLQTFGLARIYEVKAGNPPELGRRLDWWFNTLFYAGPVVAGATMLDHFQRFEDFSQVTSGLLTQVPAFMEGNQRYFTWAFMVVGTVFAVVYVAGWWRLYRQGHQVSRQKVFLVASTGLVSVYTWGFNSFGMAFFIMNLFHAVQYLALVWWSEKKNILKAFSLERLRMATPIGLVLFLMTAAAYGGFVELASTRLDALWAITLVVSLMHFWYDGFIWSVRRAQV